jgi:long-subunit fatty acid transport protein
MFSRPTVHSHSFSSDPCALPHRLWSFPRFSGLSLLDYPTAEQTFEIEPFFSRAQFSTPTRTFDSPSLGAALQHHAAQVPDPWVFQGNGGRGVKTWLSEGHVLEINPHWLHFGMFESMDLSMTDTPPGPGQEEPQEWRSTFTVGLSADWHLTRRLALSAGYRFYNNPMPEGITTGAFPNANQHVIAGGLRLVQGRHSLAMIYGLDLLEGGTSAGITSARQEGSLNELAHLVTLSYGFSF